MNKYVIKKITGAPREEDWEIADIAPMNLKPWPEVKDHFNSFAQALYDDNAIYVRMQSDEMPVVAKLTERNSDICSDSCMEFFFCPNEANDIYINFEVNALGTILIGAGRERKNRTICSEDRSLFDIKPQLCENGWSVTFKIPFDFIKKYAGDVTPRMRGNFHKCGRDTGHRHYGVFNMIDTPTPDFHRPECFGELELGK